MPKKICQIICLFITLLLFHNMTCFALEKTTVSVVFSSDMEAYHQAWEGFNEFFKKNGVNLSVSTYNLANDDPETVILRIKKEKPPIVFALGTRALKLLKMRVGEIPIIVCMVINQDEINGANITGVTLSIPTMIKLQWINENLSQTKRIGLIYSIETAELVAKISQDCKKSGYEVVAQKINSGEEITWALQKIASRIDCFLMVPDARIYFPKSIEYLLMEGLKRKFAVIGLSSFYTKAGAFVSFDCDYQDIGRQTAEMAMKILNGQSPTDIPSESPRKTTFSLNLLVAEKIGIKIPPVVIKEAKEVFGR
ncbi:hypothetical protein CO110_07040 [Candidatus Desantisbacteria bacterium CG_4_9_14_3_um_filter_40_11]|uniref:ABC transporter substrate-binding protein n=2 Tax=unclassified Candidatus Desantisiibacteriota TaxID=3106372 RepID=A0A2M7JB59_9BACT|nr:MAG: hypothetical protein COZ71_07105 [Candidatus Desantisbacteria bacterium CG_4_8_14_3_um_filter_40_12]PJB29201.1 MAG: hypothetical protein CO110_07040 [Candidatus Desantisbacteria bacterium CG_4_9_14_3_um_filter_40_11]